MSRKRDHSNDHDDDQEGFDSMPTQNDDNSSGTSGPSTQQEQQQGGIAPEINSMVSLMASGMQSMQGTLGNAYQAMANNLQQSMEMTLAMSKMMEHLLLTNLDIRTHVGHDFETGKLILTITTENKCQFPIPEPVGNLKLIRENTQEQNGDDDGSTEPVSTTTPTPTTSSFSSSSVSSAEAVLISSQFYTATSDTPIFKPSSIYKTLLQPTATTTPIPTKYGPLLPGSQWVDVFELKLDTFDTYLITLNASFISPGTGKKLEKSHESSVYLLDQCQITWDSTLQVSQPEAVMTMVAMQVSCVREVLQVPALAGIQVGSRCLLQSVDGRYCIQCGITGISEDGQVLECGLWWPTTVRGATGDGQDPSPSSSVSQEEASRVIERLAQELYALGGI